MKINIYSLYTGDVYLVCATANGTLFVPGYSSFSRVMRQYDVPANTTWQAYSWPALTALGSVSVNDTEGSTFVLNASGVWTAFSQPSAVVGSSWQAQLPFTIPAWVRTDEGMAFFAGFFLIATVRLTRAGLRWLSRAGEDLPSS